MTVQFMIITFNNFFQNIGHQFKKPEIDHAIVIMFATACFPSGLKIWLSHIE